VNGLSVGLYLGGLHSAYIRGEAFVAAHRYAEAAVEFQKILDRRGIVGADPIGALALERWRLRHSGSQHATVVSGAFLHGSLAGSLQSIRLWCGGSAPRSRR